MVSHPAGPVGAGDVPADGEAEHLDVGPGDLGPDPDLDVGQAGRGPDHLGDARVGEVLQRLGPRVVAGAEHPAGALVVVGHQDGERPGLLEVGDAGGPAAEGGVEVGVHDRGHGGEHRARPVHLDPEGLADRAVVPVGPDQVVGLEGLGGARLVVGQGGRDRPAVLAERAQLGVEPQLGAEARGPVAQQVLQLVLVDRPEAARAGAGAVVLGRLLGTLVGGVAEGVRLHRLPGEAGPGVGGVQDRLLEAGLAVHLHRPWGQAPRPRVHEQVGVALHQDAGLAVVGQEQGGGQPDHAAADDEHGGSSWHGCSLSFGSVRWWWGSRPGAPGPGRAGRS
jgi:hypothetical protein